MEDWKLYIVNLTLFLDDIDTGEWFTVPVNMDEVREKIHLKDDEECVIFDYELPFAIDRDVSIEKINYLYRQLEDADESVLSDLKELISAIGSVEELVDNLEDLIFYPGVSSVEELAGMMVEKGLLGEVSGMLQSCIDYEKLVRILNTEYVYVETKNGVWDVTLK